MVHRYFALLLFWFWVHHEMETIICITAIMTIFQADGRKALLSKLLGLRSSQPINSGMFGSISDQSQMLNHRNLVVTHLKTSVDDDSIGIARATLIEL